jgi:hypothetical protein
MIHDAGWAAGFAPINKQADWIWDTAFFVKSQQSGRIYWFLADQGSSGYIYLYSTRDVMQPGWKARGPDSPDDGPLLSPIDNTFMSADQDLNFLHSFPGQTDPAPEYILLPDLPSIMRMQHDYEGGPRLDFFKLIACSK